MSAQQVARGDELGVNICKAVGIDPNLVRNMVVTIPADGFVALNIEMTVSIELAEVIKKELEEKKVVVNIFCEKK